MRLDDFDDYVSTPTFMSDGLDDANVRVMGASSVRGGCRKLEWLERKRAVRANISCTEVPAALAWSGPKYCAGVLETASNAWARAGKTDNAATTIAIAATLANISHAQLTLARVCLCSFRLSPANTFLLAPAYKLSRGSARRSSKKRHSNSSL